jgi:hypothetical protein
VDEIALARFQRVRLREFFHVSVALAFLENRSALDMEDICVVPLFERVEVFRSPPDEGPCCITDDFLTGEFMQRWKAGNDVSQGLDGVAREEPPVF